MSQLSKGEKWIRLLRAYCPVAENEGMQGEHVGPLSVRLGVPKLSFVHPATQLLLDCFPVSTGLFGNAVLTGTAGEGKTSLCFELFRALKGSEAEGDDGIEIVSVDTPVGTRKITLIYDVTGWRVKEGGRLSEGNLQMLHEFAKSVFGESEEFFVLAINDGQMHELFRALPDNAPDIILKLKHLLIRLHARGETDGGQRLRFINLSKIPSESIMGLCLDAILERAEWTICFEEERENPLFSNASSLTRNYHALKTPEVQAKLIMLAKIADATGRHLPTRGVLCLLCNALLGHPDAGDGVIRLGVEARTISSSGTGYKAAVHRTIFGENLTATRRRKREVYQFLSMLHVGEETTNDLDDLLIFGTRDEELAKGYADLVKPDPFGQRNPEFDSLLQRYIRGEINEEKETALFLSELASERRRVFLRATSSQLKEYQLWKTTVFHNAQEYLEAILAPLEDSKRVEQKYIRKLASGLNRIWTGLLLEKAPSVYLATGLDLTTSPVSDIYHSEIAVDFDPPSMEVVRGEISNVPLVVLSASGRKFQMPLTLPRFEFLCRVADGAMPSSFSRESCSDFMSLKQRCLRDLGLKENPRVLYLFESSEEGLIQRHSLHFSES